MQVELNDPASINLGLDVLDRVKFEYFSNGGSCGRRTSGGGEEGHQEPLGAGIAEEGDHALVGRRTW